MPVYKSHIEAKEKEYLEKEDFFAIRNMFKKCYEKSEPAILPYRFSILNKENKNVARNILKKRTDYLELKLFRMGIDIDWQHNFENKIVGFTFNDNIERQLQYQSKQKIDKSEKEEHALIDNSDTKATEKIIYLKELGVLDFLLTKEPFNASTNALANVLSTITGERANTLQPYLNPIINPTAGQKKNALNNTKNVEKIKQSLISSGFKLQQ